MADLFQLSNLGVADDNSSLSTGDLRRKYNFGSRVSELAIAQDPFFRLVSKLAKKPCDDPQFKFTERRPSFHKRYAYVWGAATSGAPSIGGALHANTTKIVMAGDYYSAGNKGSVYGNSSNLITIGSSGTDPEFFIPGQLVKIPSSGTLGSSYTGYAVFKVTGVDDSAQANMKLLTGEMVKVPSDLALTYKHATDSGIAGQSQESLAEKRSFVIGTAFAQGSGFPQTWKDQPFSTGYGNTQIWKTAMAMDNTTRATVLKYDASEWARVWKEKLIEHKFDIEQSLLFNGTADTSGDAWYTDGVVNYISGFGNQFSMPLATKTQDDFLDDLSAFLDPRYNNANATMFFVNTAVYNWLHKLSGYFANNLGQVQPYVDGATQTVSGGGNSLARADFSMMGKKKVFGVDISVISTTYGDMNVARNIHLDGTDINMLGINMRYVAYRPLVGNGLQRDTAIYVGVQTLENSGVDRRVDLIQTEAGLEIHMPESHAIWTAS